MRRRPVSPPAFEEALPRVQGSGCVTRLTLQITRLASGNPVLSGQEGTSLFTAHDLSRTRRHMRQLVKLAGVLGGVVWLLSSRLQEARFSRLQKSAGCVLPSCFPSTLHRHGVINSTGTLVRQRPSSTPQRLLKPARWRSFPLLSFPGMYEHVSFFSTHLISHNGSLEVCLPLASHTSLPEPSTVPCELLKSVMGHAPHRYTTAN